MGKQNKYWISALLIMLGISIVSAQIGQQTPGSEYPSNLCKYSTESILRGDVRGFSRGCIKPIQMKCGDGLCQFYDQGRLVAKCSFTRGKLDCFV